MGSDLFDLIDLTNLRDFIDVAVLVACLDPKETIVPVNGL